MTSSRAQCEPFILGCRWKRIKWGALIVTAGCNSTFSTLVHSSWALISRHTASLRLTIPFLPTRFRDSDSSLKGDIPNQLLRRKMPELDTLRGVAILAVVSYHGFSQCDATGLTGIVRAFFAATRLGWLGVNLFFVLSGFLITGILLDSKGAPRYYKSFYVRRALRILPAYLMLLLFLLLLPRVGIVDHRISWGFVGLSLIYLSNVTNFFGVAMQYGPYGHWQWKSSFTCFGPRRCATFPGERWRSVPSLSFSAALF